MADRAERTILLRLLIDGKEAVAELKLTDAEVERLGSAFGRTTEEAERHTGALGRLARYVREQRAEQRQNNFLVSEFRDALNLAGLAMTGLSVGGSREFRVLTDSVNAGLVAFNGINAVTGLLPGPLGLVLQLAGGIGVAVYNWASATSTANAALREHYTLIGALSDKYDELRGALTGTDASIEALARRQWELAQAESRGLTGFIDELVNGQRVETTYMGQRVEIRRKGLTTIQDLQKKYLTESQLYYEELRKAQEQGLKGNEAHEAALKALTERLSSLKERTEALRVLWQEGGVLGSVPDGLTDYERRLVSALTLAKELGDFQVRELTFISHEQAQRFDRARADMEWISRWMAQPEAERHDLVRENMTAWEKSLTFLKTELKTVPPAVHGMTEEMKADLDSWHETTAQLMSVLTNSIRTGLEAAFGGEAGGIREFLKGILLGVIDLVQGLLLAAAAAAELKGVLTFFTSLAGDFAAIAAATVMLQTLRAFVATAFAEGGVVTRPTLALIGEKGETEIVAPRRSLSRFLREELLPEVVRSSNIIALNQPAPAFAASDSSGLLREIRGLRRDLRAKDLSVSINSPLTPFDVVNRGLPLVTRRNRRIRK